MSPEPHESASWTTYLKPGTDPADATAFAEEMRHPDYPRASAYAPSWVHRNLMGPNVLWLTEALMQVLPLEPGMRVLDLGCGSAISSIFLARELGVQVWAADLWIDPSQNRPRIEEAGVSDRVFPIKAEAHDLPFAHEYFDAMVSIDSFHYYGTDVRYLTYAAQFLRPGGAIGIVVPASAVDPDDLPDDLVEHTPFGADFSTFRSEAWWARHWRRTASVEVTTAEMLPGGRELWHRHHRATAAWDGKPLEESGDEPLLASEAGQHLGFARVTAAPLGLIYLEQGPWTRVQIDLDSSPMIEPASEDPRQRVLDVAGHLFAERGFDDVTMADIAQAADVARATVFNYFGSKHALVEHLTETVLDAFGAMLDDALADTETSTPDLIRRLFEEMGRNIESQRGFFRGVFREIARIQLGLDEGVVAQRANDEAHARLLRLVERGQARGDLNDELEAGAVSLAFRSLANGTVTGWLYQDEGGSLVYLMGAAADVLLSSVERIPTSQRSTKGARR